MTKTRPASLLIVLAHPDDEVFHGGVLAHLRERGVRVVLVCATDGDAGKVHPSVGPVSDLGALRIEELRLSCSRLGIEDPVHRKRYFQMLEWMLKDERESRTDGNSGNGR